MLLHALVISAPFPTPPVQTAAQLAAVTTRTAAAATSSAAATEQVLAFLESADIRGVLQECCPDVASLSSKVLLERWRAEVRAAEVAHSFPINSSFTADMNLDFLESREYGWWLNPWQVSVINDALHRPPLRFDPRRGDLLVGRRVAVEAGDGPGGLSVDAEETIFGCPPFKVAGKPTWNEAADRLVYGAQNLRRVDTGSATFFGEVGAVFKRGAVGSLVEIAAMDTGLWEMSCNSTSPMPDAPKLNIACDAIANMSAVGTFDHLDHLLLPSLAVWAVHSLLPFPLPRSTVLEQATSLFGRSALAAARYTALPNITTLDTSKYFESNLMGNVRLDGVKMLLPLFGAVFGTDAGQRLRKVADNYTWPLVWALGDGTEGGVKHAHSPSAMHTKFGGNQRWLDPIAATSRGLNVTAATPAAVASFEAVWAEVAAARAHGQPSADQMNAWWARLAPAMVRLAPLGASSCADFDGCIGVIVESGECVCSPSRAAQ